MKVLVVIFFFLSSTAVAQVASATLAGVITDRSGKAVPNARVTATRTSTGFARRTMTDSHGNYAFDPFPPGAYTIAASHDGFDSNQPTPPNNVFDFSLQRRFQIREGHAIQLPTESFNTFNHPNWGAPSSYPDFGQFFGKIFSSGDPRRMQFALRYDF